MNQWDYKTKRYVLGIILLICLISCGTAGQTTNQSVSGDKQLDSSFNLSEHQAKVALDNSAKDWNDKGYALYQQGKYNESIEAYDNALEIYPNQTLYLLNKGNALYNLEEYEKALEVYTHAYESAVGGNPKGNARDAIQKTQNKIACIQNPAKCPVSTSTVAKVTTSSSRAYCNGLPYNKNQQVCVPLRRQ